jgi:alkylation response protein AidB-like acyl-CoA dehydrogenase
MASAMADDGDLRGMAERLGGERALGTAMEAIRRVCSTRLATRLGLAAPDGTIVLDGRTVLYRQEGRVWGRIGPAVGIGAASGFIVALPQGNSPRIARAGLRDPDIQVRPFASIGLTEATPAVLEFEGWSPTRSGHDDANVDHIIDEAQASEVRAFSSATLALTGAALKTTVEYAAGRAHAGEVLFDRQAVRHALADLHGEQRMAEAAVAQAWRSSGREGARRDVEQGLLALLIESCAQRVVDGCLQFFGGSGYMTENWVGRAYCDVQALYLVFGERDHHLQAVAEAVRREVIDA